MSVTIGQQLSDILRRKVEGALVISGDCNGLSYNISDILQQYPQ